MARPAPRVRPGLPAIALALALALAPPRGAGGQSPAAEEYVRLGLRGAWGQRLQDFDVERAAARRREARALMLPTLAATSTTIEAAGNVVEIGRFVNPAYGALNQLLGEPAFPTNVALQLPLQSQHFLRLTQPLFAPGAWYANAAAARAEDAQRHARTAAEGQLATDIRLAWLDWYKVQGVLAAYDAALALVEEQVRTSERLVQAGVRAPDAVLRARADLGAVRQERLRAAQQRDAAGQLLNHMVARPLDAPILGAGDSLAAMPLPTLAEALSGAARRAELRQLDDAGRAADAQRRAASSALLPTLALSVDVGYQGTAPRFGADRDYRALSLVGQWNVFNGGADRARVEQARLELRGLTTRREEAASLLALRARVAHEAATVARAAIEAADEQLAASERAYALVRRRYEEGLAAPIELLDARRAYTSAAINRATTVADFQARRVELLHAASLDTGSPP